MRSFRWRFVFPEKYARSGPACTSTLLNAEKCVKSCWEPVCFLCRVRRLLQKSPWKLNCAIRNVNHIDTYCARTLQRASLNSMGFNCFLLCCSLSVPCAVCVFNRYAIGNIIIQWDDSIEACFSLSIFPLCSGTAQVYKCCPFITQFIALLGIVSHRTVNAGDSMKKGNSCHVTMQLHNRIKGMPQWRNSFS